jgi:hypothetical protein
MLGDMPLLPRTPFEREWDMRRRTPPRKFCWTIYKSFERRPVAS